MSSIRSVTVVALCFVVDMCHRLGPQRQPGALGLGVFWDVGGADGELRLGSHSSLPLQSGSDWRWYSRLAHGLGSPTCSWVAPP